MSAANRFRHDTGIHLFYDYIHVTQASCSTWSYPSLSCIHGGLQGCFAPHIEHSCFQSAFILDFPVDLLAVMCIPHLSESQFRCPSVFRLRPCGFWCWLPVSNVSYSFVSRLGMAGGHDCSKAHDALAPASVHTAKDSVITRVKRGQAQEVLNSWRAM